MARQFYLVLMTGIGRGIYFRSRWGACAGLRSLFALMMVSALYGYYMLKKPWQRAALFLCAMPLAVLGNFARILLLVYGTIWWGSDFAIGVADAPGRSLRR
ncbi:MAG: archaeosortase/exosortase family protein [Verrucomicrobiales bacterium]